VLAPVLPRRVDFDRRERGGEPLEAVGFGRRPDALYSELSGGQQQRVAVARALINRPGLRRQSGAPVRSGAPAVNPLRQARDT
jgi:ABC-type polar amino acid transport system ATPase subunit